MQDRDHLDGKRGKLVPEVGRKAELAGAGLDLELPDRNDTEEEAGARIDALQRSSRELTGLDREPEQYAAIEKKSHGPALARCRFARVGRRARVSLREELALVKEALDLRIGLVPIGIKKRTFLAHRPARRTAAAVTGTSLTAGTPSRAMMTSSPLRAASISFESCVFAR